jgi:GT2 family glycosyltransferase
MKNVLIAILNWNGKKFLEQFLPTVIEHSPEADILIIDNHSADSSVEYIQKNFPQIRVKTLDKNYGFTGGYNKGLEGETHQYFIFLNNDVEVTPGWIKPMLRMMEQNSKIGAVQPKMLQFTNKKFFEYSGACGGHLDKLGYPFCTGRIFSITEEDKDQYNTEEKIFWTCGAAMMVRSDAFFKAGCFDEHFFAHMEEIDLCWRIQQMGYDIYNCPASLIYHVGGGTLASGSIRKNFLNYRNSLFTLLKNYPGLKTIFIIFQRMALDGVASLYFLIKGNPNVMIAVLFAHFSFYFHLPRLILYRIKRERIIPGYRNIWPNKNYSVVYWHFIQKKQFYSELP